MNKVPTVKKVKETIGKIIYYGAVPLMLFVGYRCFKNSGKEMEEMASMMNGVADN